MRCTCLLPFLALLLALGLAGEARADTITYEFFDNLGGNIQGHIDGLANIAGPQTATDVWVDSVLKLNSPPYPASYVLPHNFGVGSTNSFSVVGGVITQAHFAGFQAGNASLGFTFDFGTPGPTFQSHSFNNGADQSGTVLQFSSFASDVPELDPGSAVSAMALLASGLAMWGGRRHRPAPGPGQGHVSAD